MNELVCESLPRFPADRVQVLHISGPQDHDFARAAYEKAPPGLTTALLPFCADMQHALAAADLALCRSGASTLTELAYYGVPAVLVPYPFAAHDHQTRNAEVFSRPGAAELWPQNDLDPTTFADRLTTLLENEATLDRMRNAMIGMAVPDASDRICGVIEAAMG